MNGNNGKEAIHNKPMHPTENFMENITFRKSTIHDLPIILELYTHFETDKTKKMTLPKAETMYEKMKQYPNYTIYVVEFNNQVIASFTLLIVDNIVHKGTPSAIIDSVIVDPLYQKKGIGKWMMQKAMDLSVKNGCYKLALSSNFKWGVHEFYKSLGFKQHGLSLHVEVQ